MFSALPSDFYYIHSLLYITYQYYVYTAYKYEKCNKERKHKTTFFHCVKFQNPRTKVSYKNAADKTLHGKCEQTDGQTEWGIAISLSQIGWLGAKKHIYTQTPLI